MSLLASRHSRASLIEALRALYEGDTRRGRLFRYGLLVFDLLTVSFIVLTSFIQRMPVTDWVDLVIGLVVLADFSARLAINHHPWRQILSPMTLVDLVVIASFLAPIAGEGGGFLRVLRTLRLLRNYQILARLRHDFEFFRRKEEVFIAVIDLTVFVFVMTGLVYETQHWTNPHIGNYADALYFTVTALTTTGFGDITLPGTVGRFISVVIMIFGVTLFLRLAQVLFRPDKVRFECPKCGLVRHDADAVHCKHCGDVLHIETEGAV